MEGGGGGALATLFDSCICLIVSIDFRARMAPQINLGRLETYRSSGRPAISLLQGRIRVMSY